MYPRQKKFSVNLPTPPSEGRCWEISRACKKMTGYRSALEKAIAEDMDNQRYPYFYEPACLKYTQTRSYLPDFVLSNGIVIEAKGRWHKGDKTKFKLLKKQIPHLDLRFVFSNADRTQDKRYRTSYADWCEKSGFKFASKLIPRQWLEEKKEMKRINALLSFGFKIFN